MVLVGLASLGLGACATTSVPKVLSVQEVVLNRHKLDGKIIVVRGWLAECRHLSCSLYVSRQDQEKSESGGYEATPEFALTLSIGGYPDFERWLRYSLPAEITLKAKLDAGCISGPTVDYSEYAIAMCTDRSNVLDPIKLIEVVGAEKK